MKTTKFKNKETLENELVNKIAVEITTAIKNNGDARILISGGSTPLHLYSLISNLHIDWKKVKVGLVDERFIDTNDQLSNEKQIRETLIQNQAKEAIFYSMIHNIDDEKINLKLVNDTYMPFNERIDFILLGMGNDGHTASIFPKDEASEKLLNSKELGIFSTKAPNYPYNRITCSKELIKKSNSTILYFTGDEKLKVMKNAEEKELPISFFINNLENFETYFTS